MKLTQPSLTIVSVTGHQDYAQGSLYAIIRSYQELKPQIHHLKCLLISPEKPQDLPDFVTHISCCPFSYFEYNLFILYSLGQLITTDFALIVQNDGWVMNGNNWDSRYFDYDYIGAPIPLLAEPNPVEHKAEGFDFWLAHKDEIPSNMFEPQNGGFSLRSKRLLDMPRQLQLKWDVPAPKLFDKTPLSFSWKNGDHNEDIYLSIGVRKELEKAGIKFAPSEIAATFAVENYLVQRCRGVSIEMVLGGHFAGSAVLTGVNDVYLRYLIPIENKESILSNDVYRYLYQLGYHLTVNVKS